MSQLKSELFFMERGLKAAQTLQIWKVYTSVFFIQFWYIFFFELIMTSGSNSDAYTLLIMVLSWTWSQKASVDSLQSYHAAPA